MGFFSFQCKGCGNSILSPYAIGDKNAWMAEVTAVYPDGTILSGTYDGYGRIAELDDDGLNFAFEDVSVWHTECWLDAGSPGYNGCSEHADDQGYFFDDDKYDFTFGEMKRNPRALRQRELYS